jgi:adenylate cyclase
MLGQLAPCGGGPAIPLLKPKLLVGRQSFCDIPLRYPAVSSRHCELELIEGTWFVRDLGSRNGTRVNNAACASQWLMPNDVLAVAHYRYAVIYKAAVNPQRPAALPVRLATPVARPDAPAARATAGIATNAAALGQLVPCGGGDPIRLTRSKLVVGRHDTCDIVLPFPTISGRHCEIEFANGYWYVRDLGSRNGVRVDGVRCVTDRLKPGCTLWVAGLRFQVVYTAPASSSEPAAKSPLFSQSLLQAAGLERWQAEQHDRPTRKADDEGVPSRPRYKLDDPD